MPALERRRQEDLCEVKANLVYTVRSGPAKDTQRLCLKKKGGKKSKNILFSREERGKI